MPPLFFYSQNSDISILDGMKRILILLADNNNIYFDFDKYKIIVDKKPHNGISMHNLQYNNLNKLNNSDLLLTMELRQRFFSYMFNVYFFIDCSFSEAKMVLNNYYMSCYEQ